MITRSRCRIARREDLLLLMSDESVVGTVGLLTVATRGAAGAGEVMLKVRGGSEAYLAWSADPLPKGAHVLVISQRGPRTVDVVPWENLFLYLSTFSKESA